MTQHWKWGSEDEARELLCVEDQPGLHSEYLVSLGYVPQNSWLGVLMLHMAGRGRRMRRARPNFGIGD